MRRETNDNSTRPLERLVLDPRAALFLVEVDDVRYLVGVSDRSVRLLRQLTPESGRGEEAATRLAAER